MALLGQTGPSAASTLILLDAALAAAAWPVAASVALSGQGATAPSASWPGLLLLHLLYPATFLLLLYGLGLYRRDALLATRRSVARAAATAVLAGLAGSGAHALLPASLAVGGGGVLFAAAAVCFAGTAFAARAILFLLRRRGAFRRRVLVVGAGARAFDLALLLRREGGRLGYDLALAHDAATMGPVDPRLAADPACRVLNVAEGFLAAAQAFDAEQIVVAADERRGLPMQALLACRTAGFPVLEYTPFLEREIGRVDVKRPDLGWLLYSDGFAFGPLDRALKRGMDVLVSAALLLATLPFLLAAALAVKLEDGGPVLYAQLRVTRGGRVFRILKLRTMRVDAERAAGGAVWAAARDPRVTRVGGVLRRTRLDELPQLLNVLRGEMSFVGPRPERPEFTRELAEKLPLYAERHVVRAGLTGWAQVNYPYGASLDDARSKLSYDLYYVKNSGVLFDLLIILQTLRVVIWPGAGAVR